MPADRVTSKNPWHIVLVLDDSGSMKGAPAGHVNEAVSTMIEELKLMSAGVKPYFKISIINFGSQAVKVCEAESEQKLDPAKVATLQGASGNTDAAAALLLAYDVLQNHQGRPTDFTPYVFFMSDGIPNDENKALDAGQRLKALQLEAGSPRIVTIGFGEANDAFMEKLASNPELYKRLSNSKEIVKLFPAIGTIAQSAVGTAAVDQAIMSL